MDRGRRIKEARKAAGITQKELGSRIGVAYQTVAQWENGLRTPKWETIERIAAALNVPESYFWESSSFSSYEAARDQYDEFITSLNATPHIHKLIESIYGKEEIVTVSDDENFFKEKVYVFGSSGDSIALSSDCISAIEHAVLSVTKSLVDSLSSTKKDEISHWESWFSSDEAKGIRERHAVDPKENE